MSDIKAGDRIHCDKWLAHRDDGWEVTGRDGFWNDSVSVQGADFTGGLTHFHVPLADCTLIPPALQVGDRVRVKRDGRGGVLYAVVGQDFWVGFPSGSAFDFGPAELERIP